MENIQPKRYLDETPDRKQFPLATGCLDYFPDALAYVAYVSRMGNLQHNPGMPLHWSFGKSMDHADTLLRHLQNRGFPDTDGVLHSGKVAWRALALLQVELMELFGLDMPAAAKMDEPPVPLHKEPDQ